MCGRTFCMLGPDDIRRACSYRTRGDTSDTNDAWNQPSWSKCNGDPTYARSYNIAPGSTTPVLVSGKHFPKKENVDVDERVLHPMMWGLIPSFHKGKASEFAFKTNNCRSETFLTKSMFKRPAEQGRRCVVICEGYYEWKTESKSKQPYLIHCIQPKNISLSDEKFRSNSLEDMWDDKDGWKGPRLLFMAGIFDVWCPEGEPIYSYSILTMESSDSMSWLHHRMPVILDSEDAIEGWLNFDSLPLSKATNLIQETQLLKWYPVSKTVSNSRNNLHECIIPFDIKKPKISNENKLMMAWLKKGNVKKEEESEILPSKRIKTE